jgi:hypothetical protein
MKPSGHWLVLSELTWNGSGDLIDMLVDWFSDLSSRPDTLLLDQVTSPTGFLDPVVVLAELAEAGVGCRLGVVLHLGEGSAVSVGVRELTALDHLALGGAALVMAGSDDDVLTAAAGVALALQAGPPVTAGAGTEQVVDAPNLPAPVTPGGFPLGILRTYGEERQGERVMELLEGGLFVPADSRLEFRTLELG